MRLGTLALAGAALVAACDLLPTELPRWETEWDVVPVRDTVATGDLLPDHVRLADPGFAIDSFAATSRVRLADVCELCTCFEGPVPPLEITPQEWPVRLPPGLVEADMERGTARLVLHNEIGFDLLDDGAGGRGWVEVELLDRTTGESLQVERVSRPFPPGDSLVLSFELGGRRLHSGLAARVSGRTPGSGCRSVTPGEDTGFRARVELRDVRARHVDVLLSDAAVSLRDRSFAMPGALADRLRAGDADAVVEVELVSSVPAAVEAGLSVARSAEALFTGEAALHTPLLLPGGLPGGPARVARRYVLDLAMLEGAERLHVAAHNRVSGPRLVRLSGGEALSYRVRLLAKVPVR